MADLNLVDGFYATPQRFLWHPATRTAVLADLHLGFEESLTRRGNLMPEFTGPAFRQAWEELQRRRPAQIIVAGDIFHDAVPAESTVAQARELFSAAGNTTRIILLRGNHDPALPSLRALFPDPRIEVQTHTQLAGWCVIHGDDLAPLRQEMKARDSGL